ncbi:hypothetical protein FAI40_10035 [Acetobacteraceae bacterium]|nr:hypothetical protein FAI40_10035 [Acetobacteraceae bacterium]
MAPEKITSLNRALNSLGGGNNDAGEFLAHLQDLEATQEGQDLVKQAGAQVNLSTADFYDGKGHVRTDILDTLVESLKDLPTDTRESVLGQLGAPRSLKDLSNRSDALRRLHKYDGLGPTQKDVDLGQAFKDKTTDLKVQTEQVGLLAFEKIEPKLEKFFDKIIELEKTHPDAIAQGLTDLAVALGVLSTLLTSAAFLKALGTIRAILSLPIKGYGKTASAIGKLAGAGAVETGAAETAADADLAAEGKGLGGAGGFEGQAGANLAGAVSELFSDIATYFRSNPETNNIDNSSVHNDTKNIENSNVHNEKRNLSNNSISNENKNIRNTDNSILDQTRNLNHSTSSQMELERISNEYNRTFSTHSPTSNNTTTDNRSFHATINVTPIEAGGDPKVMARNLARELQDQWDDASGGGLR